MSSLYLPYVNIALDTFALVVALIILATCINEFSTKRIGSRHFLIFQLSVVVALTADMIGWFGEGHPSLSLMTLAANTVMACACRIAIIGFMGLCTCFSLCVLLSACGGTKNSYQTFIKANGNEEFEIEKTSGTDKKESVTDFYNLEGEVSTGYQGVLFADLVETTRVAGDDEHEIDIEFSVRYDMRDTVLEVTVKKYSYSCEALQNDKQTSYQWKDGYTFGTGTYASDDAKRAKFTFDINKYFENGKLTVEDAQETMTLAADGIVSDLSWPTTDSKYTTRNTDWEAKALADIMDAVNATLAELDAIVEANAK